MSETPTSFHVQHVARPAHVERILSIAPGDQPFDGRTMRQCLLQDGYSITVDGVRRSLDMAWKLGLVEKPGRSSYSLTARGQACRSLALFRREVYCDVMHFLLFATWELDGRRDYWSWSYAKTCEFLWRDRPTIRSRKSVFGRLSAEAAEKFPNLDAVVGTETIYAVTNWLRDLSPPFLVVQGESLSGSSEREWFSVELALLAVWYLHRARGVAIQSPLLLDDPTLELLCPLCLTSAQRIMTMIETASRTFPTLHIHTGEWGSSAVLRREVSVAALI